MKKTMPILLMLASVGSVTACKSIEPPPMGVVFIDQKELAKAIEVSEVNSQPTETGTRKMWAGIRNKTGARVVVEARAVFLGANGEPIEPPSAWRQLFIEAHTSSAFDAHSMSNKTKQATLEIRMGNR